MSGESQRWLQDDPLPPIHTPAIVRSPRLHLDRGELSAPHGHLSLSGTTDEQLRKSIRLDEALDKQLRGVPVPEGLSPRLHALVDGLEE